jgi:F-type H+-transporting ATPase subunit gamma
MAKARAIVKRRKAVRNIKKITKTMQMIATAKFQKALKRAVGTKPYTRKVRELVGELVGSIGDVEHPLLRRPAGKQAVNRTALVVITSNRGLAGAYNGSVLRAAQAFIRQEEAAGRHIDLWAAGKKGITNFNYQKRPIVRKIEVKESPRFDEIEPLAADLIHEFTSGKIDGASLAYMNFISAGQQKPDVVTLLPLSAIAPVAPAAETGKAVRCVYEFIPDPQTLLDELLPLLVKTALFQAFLDATTSENVSRMIAMKSATDNADKMVKSLTMRYNRARQSQITTELSEIMGGVEAMKA